MKKILLPVILSIVCIVFSGCSNKTSPLKGVDSQALATGSNQTTNYTYYVEGLEGVNNCAYFKPTDSVPDYLSPDEALGKICVWRICPECGEYGGFLSLDPKNLDFSLGDSIVYSDYQFCSDCGYNKVGNSAYEWAVRITRVPE